MKKPVGKTAAALFLALFSATGCGLIVENDLTGVQMPEAETSAGDTETGDPAPETVTPFTPYEETDFDAQIEKYLNALPDSDFGGASVFITSPTLTNIEPDNLDTAYSQLAYERNRMLEDRYGVALSASLQNETTMLEEAKNAVASGSYYTDFLMVPLYLMGDFKSAGVLENLRSLPYLDMEQPYFYEESAQAFSAGYSTWGISGYASVTPSDMTAVYFSKDLIRETGMEMPYSLVNEGKWTWDAFYTYVSAVQDLNGQLESPRYYTVTAQETASRLADLVYHSCGQRYVLSGELLIPSIAFTAETAAPGIEYASRIFADERSITDSTAGAAGCFSRGESLFLMDYVYVSSWLTNASADWGIVPLPKMTESAKHQTLVANTSLVFTVPYGTNNTELVSVLLSAINAASYHELNDAYVEHSMIYTLRDNESVNMLDQILDTVSFDFSLAFGHAYPNIAAGTYQLVRETAASGTIGSSFHDKLSKANMILAEYFPLG